MFTKWIIKNGIGSPAKTAKVYCDRYKYFYEMCNGDAQQIFNNLFSERERVVLHTGGNNEARYYFTTADKLILIVNNDLPNFIFIMCFLLINSRSAYNMVSAPSISSIKISLCCKSYSPK